MILVIDATESLILQLVASGHKVTRVIPSIAPLPSKVSDISDKDRGTIDLLEQKVKEGTSNLLDAPKTMGAKPNPNSRRQFILQCLKEKPHTRIELVNRLAEAFPDFDRKNHSTNVYANVYSWQKQNLLAQNGDHFSFKG